MRDEPEEQPPTLAEGLPPASVADSPALAGSLVGDVKILSPIGRGAMGFVYLGHQQVLNRKVAVKFLDPARARHGQSFERFRRETRVLAGIRHPNLATIHEVGSWQCFPYHVTDYFPGGTLEEFLASRPRLEDAVRALAGVARGLGAAHRRGYVHRDVKPDNILFDEEGTPKLVDFGLVRALEEDDAEPLTRPGQLLGTPMYMAPEQISRRNREVGPATDVYACGVILYQAITGRHPFEQVSLLDLQEAILNRRPGFAASGAPRQLVAICKRCMAKDPARRPADGDALAALLDEWLEPVPRRLPPHLVAGAVLLASAGLGAGVVLLLAGTGRGVERSSAPRPTTTTATGRARPAARTQATRPPRKPRASSVPRVSSFAEALAGSARQIEWRRDGARMVLVAAGEFWMGSDPREYRPWQVETLSREERRRFSVFRNETPRHRVVLPAFYIDRHPVTWGRYRRFLAAARPGGHPTPWCHRRCPEEHHDPTLERANPHPRRAGRRQLPLDWRGDQLPVTCVSWWDAFAYARWAGKDLPAEAQWEKAARWDPRERRSLMFPWGDHWDPSRCNTFHTWATRLGRDPRRPATWNQVNAFWRAHPPRRCRLEPVGSRPAGASPWGVHEMAGTVMEWTADVGGVYTPGRRGAAAGSSAGDLARRVFRGGSWNLSRAYARSAYRSWAHPSRTRLTAGFRCVSRRD